MRLCKIRILPAFKHCGDSIMLGCSFATSRIATLHKMEMDEGYLKILKLHLKSTARRLKLGHNLDVPSAQ